MADFLTEKRNEITARMKELDPAVKEHNRLEEAAAALDRAAATPPNGASAFSPPTARRRPGRPPGSKRASRRTSKVAPAKSASVAAKPETKRGAKRRAGRRRGTGKRGAEALAVIQKQPGITIPEIAIKMGMQQPYLYRILPGLEQAGSIRKEKRGWHPVTAAA